MRATFDTLASETVAPQSFEGITVEFHILGALEVRHEGSEVPIRGAHQRKALAILLLDAGRTVSVQRLIEALWEGEPPATARRQVRNIVAALRRSLAEDDPIERSGDGYRLTTEATDWHDFRAEVAKAEAAGADAVAHRLLHQALQRWRGPVLAGLDCALIGPALVRMEEQRLAACEDYYETAIALGLHQEILGEVGALAAEHPYRRRLAGQLMLAFYRSGNSARALQAYNDLGARLGEELGIEPDRQLRDLYVAILREDPSLDLKKATPPPEEVEPLTAASLTAPTETGNDEPPRPARPHRARRLALTIAVLLIAWATASDGTGRLEPMEKPSEPTAIDWIRDPGNSDLSYPTLEGEASIKLFGASALILDQGSLRLESQNVEIWAKRLDFQSIPDAALAGETIILSFNDPGDRSPSTGTVMGIDLNTGVELWRAENQWLMGIVDNTVITVGCKDSGEAATCTMTSVRPTKRSVRWQVELDFQVLPAKPSDRYDNPWRQNLPTDYLLVRADFGTAGDARPRLVAFDIGSGAVLSDFDYTDVEDYQVNGDYLMVRKQTTVIADDRCEATIETYRLDTGVRQWSQAVTTPKNIEQCRPFPSLQGSGYHYPATIGQTAALLWIPSGEIRWSAPEPSSALLVHGDLVVTGDERSGGIDIWSMETHEKLWSAHDGEQMWAHGSTLWVMDESAIDADCGGLISYDFHSGDSICLSGSLEFIDDYAVVIRYNGRLQIWPIDLWAEF
ncbi:BTAD domain-containing putative transcriptional regulator [Glycomyces harbinensis]|uniref:DNA-binding transcriptional activator of the SARP family n=1 Tax=Glycomyces harbinensis TaxID=58114 RepID=A0A1G6VLF1_9ACTN|nr:BTAD domain-containing putative transcriptional regulator [Glycomyces harbinensis]SDD54388.1 DNA-binding transcriptional activator of the SARP family [Glycomyces harbinensis]